MLFPKHFVAALTFQQQVKQKPSAKSFNDLPDTAILEIAEYLDLKDLIRLGMTNKALNRDCNMVRDSEVKEMIKKTGIEDKMDLTNEAILMELRTFSSVVSYSSQYKSAELLKGNDLRDAVKRAYILYPESLHLPNLALAALKGQSNLDDYYYILRNVFGCPAKYRDTLKYLSTEHFKCKRNELIWIIKKKTIMFYSFRFTALSKYNDNSRIYICLRDGTKLGFTAFSFIALLLFAYEAIFKNVPAVEDHLTELFLGSIISGFYLHRYLDERFEKYKE